MLPILKKIQNFSKYFSVNINLQKMNYLNTYSGMTFKIEIYKQKFQKKEN